MSDHQANDSSDPTKKSSTPAELQTRVRQLEAELARLKKAIAEHLADLERQSQAIAKDGK